MRPRHLTVSSVACTTFPRHPILVHLLPRLPRPTSASRPRPTSAAPRQSSVAADAGRLPRAACRSSCPALPDRNDLGRLPGLDDAGNVIAPTLQGILLLRCVLFLVVYSGDAALCSADVVEGSLDDVGEDADAVHSGGGRPAKIVNH